GVIPISFHHSHNRHSPFRERLPSANLKMRVTLTEAEKKKLIEKEKKERRVARLIQVRSQARAAAQSILHEVRTKKEEKAAELSERVKEEMREELRKSAMERRREEERKEREKEQIKRRSTRSSPRVVVDHSKPAQRGMEALKRLKEERRTANAEKKKAIQRMERAKAEATRKALPPK
ncbi:hypothetical protein PFISCL1PPCAC_8111, partial [Pristionchus fissidentatus]